MLQATIAVSSKTNVMHLAVMCCSFCKQQTHLLNSNRGHAGAIAKLAPGAKRLVHWIANRVESFEKGVVTSLEADSANVVAYLMIVGCGLVS